MEQALKHVKDNERLAVEEEVRAAAEAHAKKAEEARLAEESKAQELQEKMLAEEKAQLEAERLAAEAAACETEQAEIRRAAAAALELEIEKAASARALEIDHRKSVVGGLIHQRLTDMMSQYVIAINSPVPQPSFRVRLDRPCICCTDEDCIGEVGLAPCKPCERKGLSCRRCKFHFASVGPNTHTLTVAELAPLLTHRRYGVALRAADLCPALDILHSLGNAEDVRLTPSSKQALYNVINTLDVAKGEKLSPSPREGGDAMDIG